MMTVLSQPASCIVYTAQQTGVRQKRWASGCGEGGGVVVGRILVLVLVFVLVLVLVLVLVPALLVRQRAVQGHGERGGEGRVWFNHLPLFH